jgi:hypothetical protein
MRLKRVELYGQAGGRNIIRIHCASMIRIHAERVSRHAGSFRITITAKN